MYIRKLNKEITESSWKLKTDIIMIFFSAVRNCSLIAFYQSITGQLEMDRADFSPVNFYTAINHHRFLAHLS